MEKITGSTCTPVLWKEAPIGMLSPQMVQEVLSWTGSTSDWLSAGGTTRNFRENIIVLTRSEFVSKIEEFRRTLFSYFETCYEGRPFTEQYKKILFRKDFGKVQEVISEISTEGLEQASSFTEIKEELIQIENAFMEVLSTLSLRIFKALGQKFELEADWIIEEPKRETINEYRPYQRKLNAVLEKPRPSWRSTHELADYLFRLVFAQRSSIGLEQHMSPLWISYWH